MSIAAIAYEVSFGSQSHMTTVFRKTLNITPGLYRHQVTPEKPSDEITSTAGATKAERVAANVLSN